MESWATKVVKKKSGCWISFIFYAATPFTVRRIANATTLIP